MTRLLCLLAGVMVALSAHAADPKVRERIAQTSRPIQWPDDVGSQIALASAIAQSVATDARTCSIGLKVYTRGDLPGPNVDACETAIIEFGASASRFHQATGRLLAISKEGNHADDAGLSMGIEAAHRALRDWAFIRERTNPR